MQKCQCLFPYRTAIHKSTGYTLFLATFGRTPNLPVDVILGSCRAETQPLAEYVRKTQTTLKTVFTEVHERLKAAHAKQKQLADKEACVPKFHVGNRVWLFVLTVKRGQTKKFISPGRGPYTILNKVSAVNYRIQLIGGQQMKTIHTNRLKLCSSTPMEPEQHFTNPAKGHERTTGFVTLDKDASNREGDKMERGPLDHVEEQETPIFAEEDNTKRDDNVENTRRKPK